MNDAADPSSPDGLVGDTPGPLGINDWAIPNSQGAGLLLLASAAVNLPAHSEPPAEYAPNLGTNRATVVMYDKYFNGPHGPLLKSRIEAAATQVDINPGLLAVTLLAEDKVSSYTKRTGEVDGWDIGVDDYRERKADIERKIPAARALKPIRYAPQTNERGRVIPHVPVFRADQAVLAVAVYLKSAELKARDVLLEEGGSFDRLPIEYQFAFTRFAMNAGPTAMRKQVRSLLGITTRHGKPVRGGRARDFFRYKPWKLEGGIEQFSRLFPQRAATAHVAQAIHLSQKIFGITPTGGGDSLLFVH
jgi:hypothetical protein